VGVQPKVTLAKTDHRNPPSLTRSPECATEQFALRRVNQQMRSQNSGEVGKRTPRSQHQTQARYFILTPPQFLLHPQQFLGCVALTAGSVRRNVFFRRGKVQ